MISRASSQPIFSNLPAPFLPTRFNGYFSRCGEYNHWAEAKALGAPLELVIEVHKTGRSPVVNFAAGGVATPADAALMMQLGAEGVFVGSGVFKSSDPETRAQAIVKATTHYQDPVILAEVSKGLGTAMPGLDIKAIPQQELLSPRGW